MQNVRFLVDFRGRLTDEKFYTVGTVAPFSNTVAASLVEDRRAEYVAVEVDEREEIASEPPAATVEEKPKARPRTRRKAKA